MTYSAPADSINAGVDPSLFMATGSYVGDGVSEVVACGFQPRYIFVCATSLTNSRNGGSKSNQMPSNNAIASDGGSVTGITITSTGFTVDGGSQFNYGIVLVTYYWTAWK